VHRHLQRAHDILDSSTSRLDADSLMSRPPGKWSAAEILEHLMKAYAGTAYILTRAVESGVPKGGAPTMRDRLSAFLVVDLGYLPSGREAPAVTRPEGLPPDGAAARAFDALRALDEAAARAEARFGRRVKLANHPILGPFDVRQWRRFHLVHTRHHARQIARLSARLR
jgi:hypothetical protein